MMTLKIRLDFKQTFTSVVVQVVKLGSVLIDSWLLPKFRMCGRLCDFGNCRADGRFCSYIVLSADLCERGYKRVYLPSSAPLVFVSNKFADNNGI